MHGAKFPLIMGFYPSNIGKNKKCLTILTIPFDTGGASWQSIFFQSLCEIQGKSPMSSKAARGTKRLCEGCGAKFYDLNNDPIICPMCEEEFKIAKPVDDKEAKAREAEELAAAEKAAAATKEEASVDDSEIDPDVAAVDDEDLADLDDTDDTDDTDDATDAFLSVEDEGEDDVIEILGDNKPKVEDDS
jgi:uncharacterized protein (TIGR02300 family)